MKALLALLLGAVLCLDSGSSLRCYSCSPQFSNSKCQSEEECKENETCRTDVFRIRGFFNIISKGCEPSCKESHQDFSIGSRNVSCCSGNLCNINAAGSVHCNYGMAAGIAGTVLWTFLNNRL